MEDAAISFVKRPLLTLLFSAVVFNSPTMACLNDYVPNVAAVERSKSIGEQLQKHAETEPWNVRRDRLRKELAAGGDYKVKNDLANSLAHTSEAAEAVTLLEQIEAEKPGMYVTAANLGTAYELSGDDEKSLEWILKGIERNPSSHEGTEWLHVRILKAKLAMKNDPKWLETHSIVDPEKAVGAMRLAATGNHGEKLSSEQIKRALIYQLHERLQFVLPPNAIVGALLLDLTSLIWEEPVGQRAALSALGLANTYLKDEPNTEALHDVAFFMGRGVQEGSKRSLPHFQNSYEFTAAAAMFGIVCVLFGALVIALKRWAMRWADK